MKKRIYALTLALSLGLASLAGCGDKSTYTEPTQYSSHSDISTEQLGIRESAPASKSEGLTSPSINWAPEEEYDTAAIGDSLYGYEYYEEPYTGETYELINESGFLSVARSPLSTFAADVDTASYSNMRRFVNSGYGLYDFGNVGLRTEELINYFNYNYKAPQAGARFAIDTTVSDCPWNKQHKLMILGINTKTLTEGTASDNRTGVRTSFPF